MQTQAEGVVGPFRAQEGSPSNLRQGKDSELIVQELHGRYYEQVFRKNVFLAHAIVTAPAAYTATVAVGGPLIWNPLNSGVNVAILGVGIGTTVVTTVAAVLGLTGATAQQVAPTATTAIDSKTNMYIGGGLGSTFAYRIGTVTVAGSFFMPIAQLHTGALTVDNTGLSWTDLGGALVIPPGCWGGVAASVAATTAVCQIAMLYEEIPV